MNFKHLFRKKPLTKLLEEVKHGEHQSEHNPSMDTGEVALTRTLHVRDLTAFGIAAIIGAGSFSSMGAACFSGGPGVIFLFIICAVACGFTALCYAEFASRVPTSGSAYTYAYVAFGEMFAWIIGWALLMEYSIGNIYVAFAWSGYFTNLIGAMGFHIPEWLTINYTAAHQAALKNVAGEGMTAWNMAPMIGNLKIIFDLPAVIVNGLITWLVYVGVKESRNFSNTMVVIKLAVIVLVIVVGCFYVDIDNWTPFMPNGFGGVMAGVAAVFFAYIGFDAVSTLAEESKNPQRDLPLGMIYSLVICTVLYIILSLVLTGMVKSDLLGVSDPLAEVFKITGVKWMLFVVSIAAVVAMTSVLLVFQMGQPRIWMSMSRDGLLPKRFSNIHPKYKTPAFATIITGLVVGVPLFFTDENFVLDFTSIGTLFAFVLVCGGVLMLPRKEKKSSNSFQLPYINGKFIVPILVTVSFSFLYYQFPDYFKDLLNVNSKNAAQNIPMLVFIALCGMMSIFSFLKNFSLIPVLGVLSCCYLLTGMAVSNWSWFAIWLIIGLVVYLLYGYKHSKLNKAQSSH